MSDEKRVRFELDGGGVAWVFPSDARGIIQSKTETGVSLIRVLARDVCDTLRVRMSSDEVQARLSGEVAP